jgi:hypothetical protein
MVDNRIDALRHMIPFLDGSEAFYLQVRGMRWLFLEVGLIFSKRLIYVVCVSPSSQRTITRALTGSSTLSRIAKASSGGKRKVSWCEW